ncbi:MAG TPA: hypothetical protein VKS20_01585 [Candidatus Acidoferrales bacterium]|nr:hypothetical protein [Candidatus Acidoferrales bacterium]
MPVETYPDQLEPSDHNAVIWRFMDISKFTDLMGTGELYFCRADLFQDKSEGLPPENYLPSPDLHPLDIADRRKIDDSIGCVAQFREAFYVNCWHLFREETWEMWEHYGKDGVAICSNYRVLKASLDAMHDRAFIGLVRYGSRHMTGWNLFRFIMTKRAEFAGEREVRAFLWIIDPHAGINRHIDADNGVHDRPLTPPPDRVLKRYRRKVDVQELVSAVVVSPRASGKTFGEIDELIKSKGYVIPVLASALACFRELLPEQVSFTLPSVSNHK